MDVKELLSKGQSNKKLVESSGGTLDRSVCTVISALPFRIREQKPGLFPTGLFSLPPVKEPGEIASLVINEGFYYTYVGEGKHIEQFEKAVNIANAVVNDYVNAQLGVDQTDEEVENHAKPALFWVYGAHSTEEAAARFNKEITLSLNQQRKWFGNLVKIADDDWNKYRQHKMISDLQRYAADALQLKREWSTPESTNINTVQCPACTTFISSAALICPTCRTIVNQAQFDRLGLKQAV